MQAASRSQLDTVLGWIQDPGLSIIVVLLVAWAARHFGGVIIARLIKRLIHSSHMNVLSADDVRKRQNTLVSLFAVIWKALVLIVAGFVIFKLIFPRVDLTPVFASSAIIGIVIGLGAQSIIKDFLSGVLIIMENQYRVGDVVDLSGAAGTIERVTIRSTILRDGDGNVHFVPNGTIAHVINKTMGYSRVNLTLGVVPETDIDTLSEVIDRIGKKMAEDDEWKEKLIEPPRFLSIGAFSDTSLAVKITAKTQPSTQWAVTGELRRRLLKAFTKHSIELSSVASEDN